MNVNMRFSDIPYYGTRVTVNKSKDQIEKLFSKYNIKILAWMLNDQEDEELMFSFPLENNTRRIVKLTINRIYANWRLSGKSPIEKREIPKNQRYRMLYFYLKNTIESAHFGFEDIKLEDVFYTNTLVKVDNKIVKMSKIKLKGINFQLKETNGILKVN